MNCWQSSALPVRANSAWVFKLGSARALWGCACAAVGENWSFERGLLLPCGRGGCDALRGERRKAWPLCKTILLPCGREGFFSACYLGRLRGGQRGRELVLWDEDFSALRAQGLFLCSQFGPPARRAARGPVRGCRPSEAPSALPPDDPAGLSKFHQPSKSHLPSLQPALWAFQLPTACEGCASFAAGASLPSVG